LASAFAVSSHTHAAATGSSNGFMSNTDYTKLSGVATGAEVNQNAFSNVLVGSTTIQADAKTDTLEIVNGANITVTSDATNDRLTVAVTGTVPTATTATTATTAAACTGNAATATKLATARTLAFTGGATGSGSFDGSANASIALTLAGNAPTATKLATARTIAVSGAVTGSGSFDGSGNLSIVTSGGVPSGMIAYYPVSSPPSGWLECNGAAVSRTTYSTLYSVIGTIFGVGNGSTTFNLPDLRGQFVRGYNGKHLLIIHMGKHGDNIDFIVLMPKYQ
jgi:hypothetical protein